MKKIVVFFVFLFSISCNKKIDTQKEKIIELKVKDFVSFGESHNKQLSEMFSELRKMKNGNLNVSTYSINYSLSNDEYLNLAESIAIDNIQNNSDPIQEFKNIAKFNVNNVFAGQQYYTNSVLYTNNLPAQMSTNGISYLTILNTIIEEIDIDANINITQNRIISLEQNIESSNLSNSEKTTLFITTSIAKSSTMYWYQEKDEWSSFFQNTAHNNIAINSANQTFGFWSSAWGCVKACAKGDVAGALAGAGAAAAANVIIGPGTAAYGASIVSWGAGCSIYEGVRYFLK
ncbi:MAG: hypothetical protein JST29_01045 [Bacteroidetes bacterium]|nr:hypothetical protein [Bacteroidota bacterium]MBS1592499.1 hypothetical protein [Bacteroidota bacterium]